ncbi:MAG: two-component sensor histidine kinase [Planctomycetes bacterium]|nr:two-component sensor histidine kinase [Planctomycetota bacterium]
MQGWLFSRENALMIKWWWLLVAAGLSTGACAGILLWLTRRTWRNARRLTARSKGHEHLVELGQLAGGLAHEIKNPLSTINVNLQLLSEDIDRFRDDEHRRWLLRLRNVQDEVDRVKGILADFLRYAGKWELTLETVDLRHLMAELTDFFAPQAEAAGVVIRTTHPDSPVCCRVDPHLLKQALLNLMINAVSAIDSGGELILKLSADRNEAMIEVIDTGEGIDEDKLPKIFQVYYSTKKGGSGLGLPTTRRIIREHGGTIIVESEVGTGTRFTIRLPLLAEQ